MLGVGFLLVYLHFRSLKCLVNKAAIAFALFHPHQNGSHLTMLMTPCKAPSTWYGLSQGPPTDVTLRGQLFCQAKTFEVPVKHRWKPCIKKQWLDPTKFAKMMKFIEIVGG